jgi:hypothetical protein
MDCWSAIVTYNERVKSRAVALCSFDSNRATEIGSIWIAASQDMVKSRVGIRQQELTQREPTPEDEYFFKQEREKAADEKQEREERARLKLLRSAPTDTVSDGIFGRLFRALSRQFDTKWRP